MKRVYKLLSVFLIFVLFVSGCGCTKGNIVVNKETKRKASTGEKWTVMIYMSASTLEDKYEQAGEVLASLSYDLPKNINVVVEVGACRNGWDIDGIKNDKIQDFAVQKNGIRPIYEAPIKSMGDAATYRDFLKRTIKKYPADNYISIIWGDGGGAVNGVAYDGVYEYDPLTIDELAQALKGVGTKMDIIGFDASLMSGIETAVAVAPYADYMVASEDVMPITGWDYRLLFETISNKPTSSGKEVGKVICDGAKELAEKDYSALMSMVVVDLSLIPQIQKEFESAALSMNNSCDDMQTLREIIARINFAPGIGADSPWEGTSEVVDLQMLLDAVGEATYFNSEKASELINQAVVHKTMSSINKTSCGLNVFYPQKNSTRGIKRYKNISISSDYEEYMGKICVVDGAEPATVSDTEAWKDYKRISDVKISAEPDFAGNYLLSASSSDAFIDVGVNLYKYDEEAGLYLHLSKSDDISYDYITNTYEHEIKNIQLEMNGVAVDSYLIGESGNSKIYSIPVIYKGLVSSVRVLSTKKDNDEEKYTALGIWDGTGRATGMAYRKYVLPETGDTITPIYSAYGAESGSYVEGKSVTLIIGSLTIKEKPLSDGQYIMSYEVEDLYGKKTESKPATATAVKGRLQFSK